MVPTDTSADHVVGHKMPENRHPDFEWYRKRDVIENAQTWRHIGYLPFSEST
jgi:hypothetical protein